MSPTRRFSPLYFAYVVSKQIKAINKEVLTCLGTKIHIVHTYISSVKYINNVYCIFNTAQPLTLSLVGDPCALFSYAMYYSLWTAL